MSNAHVANIWQAGYYYVYPSTTPPIIGHGTAVSNSDHETERDEYDYGSGSPGSLLRQTLTQYQWQADSNYLSANLLGQVASVTVKDGSGNQKAKTTNSYDESPYEPSGTPCTSSSTHCGDLTTTNRYIDATASCGTTNCIATHTHYTSVGMPAETDDGIGKPTTYTYDSTGGLISQIDYPTTASSVTHVEHFAYDSNTGLMTSHTDQNGQETDYTYDGMRRLANASFPDGGSVTYSYNDAVSYPNSPYFDFTKAITSSTNFVQRGTVDGLGRQIQTRTTVPSSTCASGYVYMDTTYDNEGRKYTATNPSCSSSSSNPKTTYYYDGLSRVSKIVPPDGSTSSDNVSTSYSGNCATVTDEAAKSRKSCADGLGRMTGVWEDPSTLNYETDYTYNTLDNLAQVQQKGGDSSSSNWRTRTFTYDSLSRLLTAANPESGTITYAYDSNGNLATKVAPQANQTSSVTTTTKYCYDELNRLIKKAYTSTSCSSMTPAVTYVYDGASVPSGCSVGSFSFGSYLKPRRTAMCDAGGSEAWDYDKMGRVATDQRTTNSITKTFTYATTSAPYNFDGSLYKLTYPSGHTITYTTSPAEQATDADDNTDSSHPIHYVTGAAYTPHGALAYLYNGPSSILSTWLYNSRLQPCRMAVNTSGTSPDACGSTNKGNVLDFAYDFDWATADNENVKKITDNRTSMSTRSINYTYDALNRIKTAYTDATSGSYCWGESYQYDNQTTGGAWGNLTGIGDVTSPSHTGTGCTRENLNVSATTLNRLSTGITPNFGYDSAGNVTNDTSLGYFFDAENRICSVGGTSCTTGATYVYDGDGKRIAKASGTTINKIYWYGMNSDALDESNGSGTITDEYIFFDGKRIARRVVH